MLLAIIAVILGCGLLWWGADRFVLGASATAGNFGIPPLVIGMAIVGFATSFPEMIVSGMAAWHGNPIMGVGNAIGSNIANIGLVLGLTAIIAPLTVHSRLLKREFPLLLGIMLIATILIWNNYLSRLDGIILMMGFVLLLVWFTYEAFKRKDDVMAKEFEQEIPKKMSNKVAFAWLILGFVVLFISSRMLVYGAVFIARYFGISDLVIGLTVVAVGTSLPELATSIVSALKGEYDIAIGNALGSNMFNLLAVLAMPGLISPSVLPRAVLIHDMPIMFGFTIALWIMAVGLRRRLPSINRIEGGLLLAAFIIYIVLQF